MPALVVRRLVALGPQGADMAQELVDRVFRGFEDALREMAIGDAGVARRIKAMAGDFAGRSRAYAAALDSGDARRSPRRWRATSMARSGRAATGDAASPDRAAAAAAALDAGALRGFRRRALPLSRPLKEKPDDRRAAVQPPRSGSTRCRPRVLTQTIEASPDERAALAALNRLPAIASLDREPSPCSAAAAAACA